MTRLKFTFGKVSGVSFGSPAMPVLAYAQTLAPMGNPQIKLRSFLANLPLFRELDRDEIDRLATGTREIHAACGEILRSKSRALLCLLSALALALACGTARAQERPAAFFLVASPQITDPNFRETVVLVLQHTPVVSRGIIINRRLDAPLSRFMPGDEAFGNAQQRVYFGGPVALARLSFVFRARQQFEGAVHLFDDLYLGDDAALLQRVLRRKAAERAVRVYAGHAGWAPGQLQYEIERGSWFATSAAPSYIFHEKPEGIWGELVKRASQRSVQALPGTQATIAP